jgi:hypothetical protein
VDLAGISYVPASHQISTKDDRPAEILVLHSMECPADDRHVQNWVRSLSTPVGSAYYAHYYLGPTVEYLVAELGRTVPHVGNGNKVRGRWTLGIEQAGYASFSRAEWIASGLPRQTASLVASLIAAGHGAPVWLSPSDLLRPGVRGVTSHNNMRIAFGGTSHTDPGENYPYDLVLAASVAPTPPEVLTMAGFAEAVEQNQDSRWEQFKVESGALRDRWQTVVGGSFSGWASIDTTQSWVAGSLRPHRANDGRINVWGQRVSDGSTMVVWQINPNGAGGWSPPAVFPA